MLDTAGESKDETHKRHSPIKPLHTDVQVLADQQEPIYNSFVTDIGFSLGDLPEMMEDRDEWHERVKDICTSSVTWWWW